MFIIIQDDLGGNIDISTVQFYRTKGQKGKDKGIYDKVLVDEPVLQTGLEEFEVAKIFNIQKGLINNLEATFFVVATDKNGKQYIRWMDIRDFGIPYWRGFTEKVKMTMRFVAKDRLSVVDPGNLDYTIQYS